MAIKHSNHAIFPDSILVRTFEGIVSANDILESWRNLDEKKLITPQIKGILNNLENCELTMNMEGFQQIMTFMNQIDRLGNLKIAVVSNSPKSIVFPTMAEMQETKFMIKPFSTFEAAIDWITM